MTDAITPGKHGGHPVVRANAGLLAAIACYGLWGLLPVLFLQADAAGAGAFEIVAWRTIWSLPCAGVLVLATRKVPSLVGLTLASWGALTLSAGLIAVNWSTYVWAVGTGRTLSASLGYYVLPLLNIAAGAVLFKERITRIEQAAIGLAAVGVVLQGLALGEIPWVSLILAVSFCGYGLVRKITRVEPEVGLFVECLILVAPAALYAVWLARTGVGVFGRDATVSSLLVLCGPATVVPLTLFAFAVGRLPLSVMGFLQFISPTLQFLIGIEAGEALTLLRLLSFILIWLGVLMFGARFWWASRAARSGGAGGSPATRPLR